VVRAGKSTGVNATISRGLPSSSTVKSVVVSPRTGRRLPSRTETSICTTSTPLLKAGRSP
jgi:hypothetical protein